MPTDPLALALIVGSTRPNRFADVPVRWIADHAAGREDVALDVLDLREWALPFYDEASMRVYSGVEEAIYRNVK